MQYNIHTALLQSKFSVVYLLEKIIKSVISATFKSLFIIKHIRIEKFKNRIYRKIMQEKTSIPWL